MFCMPTVPPPANAPRNEQCKFNALVTQMPQLSFEYVGRLTRQGHHADSMGA